MAHGRLGMLLGQIRQLVGAPPAGDQSDARLLERFADQRDEAAFQALVRRHGPLVLGVCRRVLRDHHDAEDAFQATFFVLARKAGVLGRRGSLAPWLYTVAYRLALRARADASRRRDRERRAAATLPTQADDGGRADLRPVLDEELDRLPEKYRVPLVLCYLDGKTHEEAARELGWPKGTVAGRLARARELLRRRLTRRGVTLSTGLLGTALAENASAAVPAGLADSAVRAALLFAGSQFGAAGVVSGPAALAEGMLRAMTMTYLKGVTVLLLGLSLIAGAGVWTHQALTAKPPAAALQHADQAEAKTPAPEAPAAKKDDRLEVKNLDASIARLLRERVETLRKACEVCRKQYQNGTISLSDCLASKRQLLEAELQLSDDPKDQLAAHERFFKFMRELEKTEQARVSAGHTTYQGLLLTKAARMEAEVGLLRARKRVLAAAGRKAGK